MSAPDPTEIPDRIDYWKAVFGEDVKVIHHGDKTVVWIGDCPLLIT